MDTHKFSVILHFEVEKTGMMDKAENVKENIMSYLPKVVMAMSREDDGLKITLPKGAVQEIVDKETE